MSNPVCIEYVGDDPDGVVIHEESPLGARDLLVKPGEKVLVSRDLAQGLLVQPYWREVKDRDAKPAAKSKKN